MARKPDLAREFFKRVKPGSTLSPIYFVHGAESYLLDRAVEAIIKAAAPEGINDFNYDVFHGQSARGDLIRAAAEMLPMMASRRIVLVRDIQELALRELEALEDYFENPSPSTCLIFHARTSEKSIDGRSSIIKKLKKSADACEFATLYENKIGEFIHKRASARGLKIRPDIEAYLIAAVGTEMAALDQALEKVDLYVGAQTTDVPRTLTLEQVQEVISDTRNNSVFDLTDALGSKDLGTALKILQRMILAGEAPVKILFMIARHFRILQTLHDQSVRNLSRNEVAQVVRVSPYFLKNYQQQARRFSRPGIDHIMNELLKGDIALKSSNLADKTILEGLFYTICNHSSAQ